MKKEYIIPSIITVRISSNSILAGSPEAHNEFSSNDDYSNQRTTSSSIWGDEDK